MLGTLVVSWQPLLEFWFGDLSQEVADEKHRARWFAPDGDFDALCADRFGQLLQEPVEQNLQHWLAQPLGRLAFILLTDQLPRNIFRGSAQAFSWDQRALQVANVSLREGDDRKLNWDQRAFLYMPFEHSEDLLNQHLAVGLFTFLRDESPKALRNTTGNWLRYAQQHRDIIARFGRFPHRNAALNRHSTEAEAEFLADSDGFGQN